MSDLKVSHPYVAKDDEIQGGKPTVKGSRIPITTLVTYYKRGNDVDEILNLYPQLTPAQVHDAISYYYDNQEQLDDEIDKLQDEDRWKEKYPPGKVSSK
jgi:uncharacterized protein (DUF433 family)